MDVTDINKEDEKDRKEQERQTDRARGTNRVRET
jgi:hypothetical protein